MMLAMQKMSNCTKKGLDCVEKGPDLQNQPFKICAVADYVSANEKTGNISSLSEEQISNVMILFTYLHFSI